jgi:hypothetical protein
MLVIMWAGFESYFAAVAALMSLVQLGSACMDTWVHDKRHGGMVAGSRSRSDDGDGSG